MSTLLDEDERALRDSVRSFLDKKIAPLVADHERAKTFPWDLLPELYEFGYVRGGVPESAGGDQMSMMMQAILMEEAGRCWGSLRTTVNVQGMVARVLAATADEGQRERFLAPLLAGKRFGWFGLTEPGAGSDAGSLRTTARRRGDGYVVNGSKLYITNALGCDFGILFVRVLGDDGEDLGVTGLLVDSAESTFGVHDIPHMPLRSTTSCELTFDDTFVPAANVLGEVGGGLRLGMSAINSGRLNMAMGAVGLSQACLEASITFCQQRQQFDRPIAAFQLVQQMVVEIATLTETSRLLGYQAARALDAGEPGRYECSMAKYYCGESVQKAATLALQLHGGAGLMEESPVERYFRDAREATIPEGTSQIQILHMGKHLLGHSAMR
ncbi:acyl-CoA dehydrogenase family protein [Nocardioides sp. cx-173]|uniref:acyl-CoA dehydrogenase family protein n=1 Tax=Nocardioides sp. cx-173 TaxID=2898796 RepID=UPI001E56B3EC|nr:acyl-CoA dehydrogenase family protein [Nocardioides sp. cx-173]MCD4524289.1 acyl-CoA dehydrogenase family protein [Nocardioides sp. cx-173]UGB41681.1 acyl-CoA dehydrogenase family protein [Nocardioides sp. cx-173]